MSWRPETSGVPTALADGTVVIGEGELLKGVRYRGGSVRIESLVMRSKSGTIRLVESEHQLAKLAAYASVDFTRAG